MIEVLPHQSFGETPHVRDRTEVEFVDADGARPQAVSIAAGSAEGLDKVPTAGAYFRLAGRR